MIHNRARYLLTDKKVFNAKPKDKDYYLSDGGGLRVRIKPTGAKSFEFRYQIVGKRKTLNLGAYGAHPKKSLKEARELAADKQKLVNNGKDPKYEEQIRTAKETLEKTVQGLYDDWMDSYVMTNRKRPEQVSEFMELDVLPQLGQFKAKDVELPHIVEVINRIVRRGSPVKADRVLSLVKQMFSHGKGKGFIKHHPCPDLQRKHFGIKSNSNKRHLNEEEIMMLFNALPKSGLPKHTQYAVILLLATAQRTGELRQARWSNIDFTNRIWVIPAENLKKGKKNDDGYKDHRIHISDFALFYFRKLREQAIGEWLFGSTRIPDQPIGDKTLTKQIRDRQREVPLKKRAEKNMGTLILPGGPWTLHQLRHTAHTGMGNVGVAPYIVEKILNHTMPGIMKVYNHSEYLPERKEALDRWGKYLDRLQNGHLDNIISISGKVFSDA